jgi:integration host factor subunit beta
LTESLAIAKLPIRRDSPMVKTHLIQRIFEQNPHLHLRDVEKVVDTLLDCIIMAMGGGNRVELRGFGTFSPRPREASIGRNPRTGEKVAVSKKVVPHFKMGKEMKARLNSNSAE